MGDNNFYLSDGASIALVPVSSFCGSTGKVVPTRGAEPTGCHGVKPYYNDGAAREVVVVKEDRSLAWGEHPMARLSWRAYC
jgi:hypothetical protein